MSAAATIPTVQHRRVLATVLMAAILGLLCPSIVSPGSAFADNPGSTGPPLTVPEELLAAAVSCDRSVTPESGRQAVLLIHGTGSTPEEAWGWNYERALPRAGFGICTVTLPERALGDFTVSAEYAVYAARFAYEQSGRDIGVIGHSQGGMMAAWIASFWPDVAEHATDVISLSGPMRGTALANTLCVVGSCSPIAWQLTRGSHTTTALQTVPRPTTTAFTSIGSRFDEIVFPQPDANILPGAASIQLQNVCPLRPTDHGFMLADAVGYRLVLDALTHDGPAAKARIGKLTCLRGTLPGTDLAASAPFLITVAALATGLLNTAAFVPAEPELPPYAQPYGG